MESGVKGPSRGFEEVSVVPCGVQKGKDRVGMSPLQAEQSEVLTDSASSLRSSTDWVTSTSKPLSDLYHQQTAAVVLLEMQSRMTDYNLRTVESSTYAPQTGLSRRYNLYFVAYVDRIYVYEPQYPEQRLPDQPDLILALPVSKPGLSGYINPDHPHGVNNLIVEDLGNEEVLVCACDDGDVVGYHTRLIDHAIRRRTAEDNLGSNLGDDVRAFLVENVVLSAWGLAVHKEARILAVSSNTHLVTVFKFALASADEDDMDHRSRLPLPVRRLDHRTEELRFNLAGHTENIPTVTFCNTPDDPNGRWLISSDIRGVIIVWDLESEDHVAHVIPEPSSIWHGYAWGVLCLDKRSFRQTHALKETFGGRSYFPSLGDRSTGFHNGTVIDISQTRSTVRDAIPWHWGFDHEDLEDAEEAWLRERETASYAEQLETSPSPATVEPPSVESDSDGGEDWHNSLHEDDEPPELELYYTRSRPHTLLQKRRAAPNVALAFMYTTDTAISLYPDFWNNGQKIHLSDPLKQRLPRRLAPLNEFRRMNMHAQIPELGVVIIASQSGRAAVLSLTKPPENSIFENCGKRLECPAHTMRLDWILPFASQERQGARPEAPLLGIAVGIVQGTDEMGLAERRWRLMMTYVDHTVLSYEIGRGRGRRRGADDVVV